MQSSPSRETEKRSVRKLLSPSSPQSRRSRESSRRCVVNESVKGHDERSQECSTPRLSHRPSAILTVHVRDLVGKFEERISREVVDARRFRRNAAPRSKSVGRRRTPRSQSIVRRYDAGSTKLLMSSGQPQVGTSSCLATLRRNSDPSHGSVDEVLAGFNERDSFFPTEERFDSRDGVDPSESYDQREAGDRFKVVRDEVGESSRLERRQTSKDVREDSLRGKESGYVLERQGLRDSGQVRTPIRPTSLRLGSTNNSSKYSAYDWSPPSPGVQGRPLSNGSDSAGSRSTCGPVIVTSYPTSGRSSTSSIFNTLTSVVHDNERLGRSTPPSSKNFLPEKNTYLPCNKVVSVQSSHTSEERRTSGEGFSAASSPTASRDAWKEETKRQHALTTLSWQQQQHQWQREQHSGVQQQLKAMQQQPRHTPLEKHKQLQQQESWLQQKRHLQQKQEQQQQQQWDQWRGEQWQQQQSFESGQQQFRKSCGDVSNNSYSRDEPTRDSFNASKTFPAQYIPLVEPDVAITLEEKLKIQREKIRQAEQEDLLRMKGANVMTTKTTSSQRSCTEAVSSPTTGYGEGSVTPPWPSPPSFPATSPLHTTDQDQYFDYHDEGYDPPLCADPGTISGYLDPNSSAMQYAQASEAVAKRVAWKSGRTSVPDHGYSFEKFTS